MKAAWTEYRWLRHQRISRVRAAFIVARQSWYRYQSAKACQDRLNGKIMDNDD